MKAMVGVENTKRVWAQVIAPRWHRLLSADVTKVVLIFLVVKLVLFSFAPVARVFVPLDKRVVPGDPKLSIEWLAIWAQWDFGAYTAIAENGYSPENPERAAHFPLFPLLIWLFKPLIPNSFVAGVGISLASLLAAVILLYRLTLREFGDGATGVRAVFYLLVYPTAFFTSTAYSESLFLLVAIVTFLFLRQGRWWLSGFGGLFASATRLLGIGLVLPFAWEYLRRMRQGHYRWDWGWLALFLIPVGLAAFAVVLRYQMNNPFAFISAQEEFGRKPVLPWESFRYGWEVVLGKHLVPGYLENWAINAVEFGSTCLFIVMTVLVSLRLGLSYGLYMAVGLLLPLSMSLLGDRPLAAMSRFHLVLFPAFMLLGHYGKHAVVDRTICVVFVTLLGLLTALFVTQWNVPGVG